MSLAGGIPDALSWLRAAPAGAEPGGNPRPPGLRPGLKTCRPCRGLDLGCVRFWGSPGNDTFPSAAPYNSGGRKSLPRFAFGFRGKSWRTPQDFPQFSRAPLAASGSGNASKNRTRQSRASPRGRFLAYLRVDGKEGRAAGVFAPLACFIVARRWRESSVKERGSAGAERGSEPRILTRDSFSATVEQEAAGPRERRRTGKPLRAGRA